MRLSTRRLDRAIRAAAAGALSLGLLASAPAGAQTPNLIGYQAAVFDDQGQPAVGPVDVDVAIFDAASAGNALYAESHPGVALVDGAFDIQIGAGTNPSGTLDADTFATSEAWLELTVDGEVLDPRQRLVAVPYALRAKVAESLDGSIGTVPFATHATTADALASISIGVDEQSNLLTANHDANGLATADGARIYFDNTAPGGAGDMLVIEKTDLNGPNPDGGIRFANKGSDGNSETSLVIDGDGNVGIGVESPQARLEIDGSVWAHQDGSWTGFFETDNYSYAALVAQNNGNGIAFNAVNWGSNKEQATIRSTNLSTSNGVAAYFENTSNAETLQLRNSGNGYALWARSGGVAALFDSSSDDAGVYVLNHGQGEGLLVENTGAADTLSAWTRPVGGTGTKQFWVDGSGVTNVRTLKIHGGADLSESFDVAPPAPETAVESGTIVAIDPTDPGKLVVSEGAYNRTVAGVIAGAGGIQPGMLLRQEGVAEADGEHPVALTGRVYARADTSNGPIRPGDLLTTSDRAGHAMKATDWQRSQGAVLGKAMSGLDDGTGLVLVLVGLQ